MNILLSIQSNSNLILIYNINIYNNQFNIIFIIIFTYKYFYNKVNNIYKWIILIKMKDWSKKKEKIYEMVLESLQEY